MSFAENLYYLRKQKKMSQESLAEELNVSRQSISKWENGEAYPETEKLIILCDMFNVSMDALLRGNVEGEQIKSDVDYKKHYDFFAKFISLGLAFVFIGVAFCVGVAGFAEFGNEDLFGGLASASLLFFVAIALFFFIYGGISHDQFKKTHKKEDEIFTDSEKRGFNKKFTLAISLFVSGILASVVAFVVFNLIAGEAFLEENGHVSCIAVAVFLLAIGACVCGICYFGIQREKFEIEKKNKEVISQEDQKRKKLSDRISSAIMLLATAAFLVCGFVWGLWHPAWIVFPIGGILCGIISAILGVADDDE